MKKEAVKVFRIKFVTEDGSLVMDRETEHEYYFKLHGVVDKDFLSHMLKYCAREKGVRVVSYKITKDEGVSAIVEWL